jgi:hypothetical protein
VQYSVVASRTANQACLIGLDAGIYCKPKNGEGRMPKEVMKWRPPGRRKRGRRKLTGRKGLED